MNDNDTKLNKKQKKEKLLISNKKHKIYKIILPIVVIAITASMAIGISFAIKNVKKQDDKTGQLGTSATYSRIIKPKNIYK
ncbi:hypothetical protein [Mycoplasma marinum]|uniref:Uncharacterized protein n=1 Tax=Mycoplasma marinum TaxID=1937190 RepID=A0A4R0XQQ7_9MOLU|nr:hypothetical protein [Mycoplasma marinum]TCG11928.1 hypothetical protein C4B24_00835 [Mycoplasma marinum]